LRTVFFGTPEWAVPSLHALLDSVIEVTTVVTNPDKPSGRKLEPKPSPVKVAALEAGLDVLQPARARDEDFITRIQELAPDVATVVAYGKILPANLLAVPRLGFVNVHFSLLPLYRGAAPVQRCLMDGCTKTGVAIMLLTEGMDEGPVLAIEETDVTEDDDAGSVGARLAGIGAPLLIDAIRRYANGSLQPQEQDHARATYAPKLSNEETKIDWTKGATHIRNQIRGLSPEPGAWTTIYGQRLKIFRASEIEPADLEPADLEIRDGELVVGTGSAALRLDEVQPAGKKRMPGPDFARGLRLPQRKARAGED
jgi:methionyl-tRNA formyltransferase